MTYRTSLNYWFPKIEAAGLPVPRTEIIVLDSDIHLIRLLDGPTDDGMTERAIEGLWADIDRAAMATGGYPSFLRTGLTSGKHHWRETCYLTSKADIPSRVVSLVEFSFCADIMGLDTDVWVVREYLPIIPHYILTRYRGMPVCREFRFFVTEDRVDCWHPYWPMEALERGGASKDELRNYTAALCSASLSDLQKMRDLASRSGEACGGTWSVDLLETERGWYVTDMAEAALSYHMPHDLI